MMNPIFSKMMSRIITQIMTVCPLLLAMAFNAAAEGGLQHSERSGQFHDSDEALYSGEPEHTEETHSDLGDAHHDGVFINAVMAAKAGIEVVAAGAGEINRRIKVYGRAEAGSEQVSHIRARFPGIVTSVNTKLGDWVEAGEVLAVIESNNSLQQYQLKAPISGTITALHANPGELAGSEALFTVANYRELWGKLKIFPKQRAQVAVKQAIAVTSGTVKIQTTIQHLFPNDTSDKPYLVALTTLNNASGQLMPGSLLEANITVEAVSAPLVVANKALHTFENNTVVFVQEGGSYVPQSLVLGRTDGKFTEVLGGLNVGDRYVLENSYLIKADIEKSGASHQH